MGIVLANTHLKVDGPIIRCELVCMHQKVRSLWFEYKTWSSVGNCCPQQSGVFTFSTGVELASSLGENKRLDRCRSVM